LVSRKSQGSGAVDPAISDSPTAAEQVAHLIAHSFIWMESLDRRVLSTMVPPLSTAQCHALAVLARQPGLSLGELARRLLTVKSNASRIVARLTALNLVERHDDSADARRVLLRLTVAGEQALSRAQEVRREALAEAFATQDPEKMAALTETLGDLVALLRRAVEP
jgi:DNA-binding MarR family transcriptional regulator